MLAHSSRFSRPLALAALLLAATGARATTLQPTLLQGVGGMTTANSSSGHRAIGSGYSPDGSTTSALLWDLRHPEAAPTILATHDGYMSGFAVSRAISDHYATGQELQLPSDAPATFRAVVWDLDHPGRLPTVLSNGGFVSAAPFAMQGAFIAGAAVDADGNVTGVLWDLRHPTAAPRALLAGAQMFGFAGNYVVGLVLDGSTPSPIVLFDLTDLSRAPKFLNATGTQVAFTGSGRYVGGADEANITALLWDVKKPKAAPRVLADPASGIILGLDDDWAVGITADNRGFAVSLEDPRRPAITLDAGPGNFSVAFGVDGKYVMGYINSDNGVPQAAFWRLAGSDCDRDDD